MEIIFVGEPHVYTINIDNLEAVESTIKKIMSSQVRNLIVAKQWLWCSIGRVFNANVVPGSKRPWLNEKARCPQFITYNCTQTLVSPYLVSSSCIILITTVLFKNLETTSRFYSFTAPMNQLISHLYPWESRKQCDEEFKILLHLISAWKTNLLQVQGDFTMGWWSVCVRRVDARGRLLSMRKE